MTVFDADARRTFAANYPEVPHALRHGLYAHPLLTLEALALLGEALPEHSMEYNRSDLPLGTAPDAVESNGLSIGDTIRQVHECNSWAVLKNIEQIPDYERLLLELLAEVKPDIEAKTGAMLRPQGFVFVSSPYSVTPFHFDPEHNILLQLAGSKTMTQYPAGNERYAPASAHEAYHSGGHRNLVWHDDFAHEGRGYPLGPGDAVFVPVMAPHYVRVGPDVSISLSITWRSEWSFAEADARGFNRILRRMGMKPAQPGRFPKRNVAKAYGYRAIRKVGLDGLIR